MRGNVQRILLVAEFILGLAPAAFAADELPVCADGQTLAYYGGKLVCGSACPAYVYGSFGIQGAAAYNIPPGNVGDIHPSEDEAGLPSGGARNSRACTFHVQCTSEGWVAVTTAGDTCETNIRDVP